MPPNPEVKIQYYKHSVGSLHINSEKAKRELKVNLNKETLPFCSEPKYLGVTLDRTLTYYRHVESLRKKLTSRVAMLWWLAGSCLGAGEITLRTVTLGLSILALATLCHSTTEYCASVWCRSAHISASNNALRTVTGCLGPTPADNLPNIAGIQPAELLWKGATLSQTHRAM